MNSAEEVAIPYNRRVLFQSFIVVLVLFLANLPIAVLLASGVLFGVAHMSILWRCMSSVVLVVYCLGLWFTAHWALFLGHCLRSHTPAFIFREDGIVDNASAHRLGLIHWTEIERVYPTDRYFRLRFVPRILLRIPRRRLVVIALKSGTAFLSRQPKWKHYSLASQRPKEVLAVDDRMLTVTATEFMQRLNEYYVTHVRREGLP